jgi:endoglucanase
MTIDGAIERNAPALYRALHLKRVRARSILCSLLVSLAAGLSRSAVAEDAAPNSRSIRLNTIGFLPSAAKSAVIADEDQAKSFRLINAADGAEVYRGQLSDLTPDRGSNDGLRTADFSNFNSPGVYRLELIDGPTSAPFRIGADIYNWPFYCSMQAMYLSRCGTAVDAVIAGKHYRHAPCHTKDALLDHSGGMVGAHKDGVGGWHDAGDYNKYTVNAAFSVGMLLRAWDDCETQLKSLNLHLPESDNAVPDYLDETRWELEWLLKMQTEDGSVYHKLSALHFCGNIMPEAELEPRYFSPPGSAATADFTAVMAHAARSFRDYDADFAERCLNAAKKSAAYLKTNPPASHPDLKAFTTGQYQSDDSDDRLLAAVELWETTGDAEYLSQCEHLIAQSRGLPGPHGVLIESDWDWQKVRNLALFTYALSKRPGRDLKLLEFVCRSIVQSASSIVNTAESDSYRRPLGSRFYWGCNGTVARQSINLNCAILAAAQISNFEGDDRLGVSTYRATMLDSLNYLFGRNPFGRSFVTGLGGNPPQHPHDRRSVADGHSDPWPGYLVGGPWPKPTDWQDNYDDYKTNEIAINWNGALVYALTAFVEPATFDQSIAQAQQILNPSSSSESAPPPKSDRK